MGFVIWNASNVRENCQIAQIIAILNVYEVSWVIENVMTNAKLPDVLLILKIVETVQKDALSLESAMFNALLLIVNEINCVLIIR